MTIDEALAISAAVDVAPIDMIVPFEDSEPIAEGPLRGEVTASDTRLCVGGLDMLPLIARRWIMNRQLYPSAGLESYDRYYREEVPPGWRNKRRRFAEAVAAREKLDDPSMLEDKGPQMALTLQGKLTPVPVWLWLELRALGWGTDFVLPDEREEESDG